MHNVPQNITGRLSARKSQLTGCCSENQTSFLILHNMDTVCLGLSTKTTWIEKYCLMFKNDNITKVGVTMASIITKQLRSGKMLVMHG